ncbi:MAG: hypothetical protein QOG52_1410 [Frankiaceae bacterium]|nr:hypothetical protein [Frankiaceae bacterium]MDQ1724382.1 hypothetical protein [Frankiaceae bacterium]
MGLTFLVTRDCVGCGACLLTCPEHAIAPWGDPRTGGPLTVLDERCTGCSACAEVCPEDACVEAPGLLAGAVA